MFSVIFDMDGTLLDTQRICIPAWDYAGKNQGFENVGRFIPNVCGMNEAGWTGFLEKNFPTMDIARFKAEARDYIIKNLVVRFMPGAQELFNYLKLRGVKVGLATGSSRMSVEHHLKEVGIFGQFDAVVCGAEVKNGKPAPDIFLKNAELMGANPADCFIFEDSANGIRAGVAAGMRCIGVADVVPFEEDVKKLMYCELDNIAEAIKIFEKM